MSEHRGRAARLPVYETLWLFAYVYLATIIVGEMLHWM